MQNQTKNIKKYNYKKNVSENVFINIVSIKRCLSKTLWHSSLYWFVSQIEMWFLQIICYKLKYKLGW